MVDHFGILEFLDRKEDVWDPVKLHTLLFDVIRSPENANRTLQIKSWPCLLTHPMLCGDFNSKSPPDVLQKMVGEGFNRALALFLLVAEDNVWFGYSWFWNLGDFIPTSKLGGPSPTKQTVPDHLFPELKCQIGKPLSPPQKVNGTSWAYTRAFEHATVHADLSNHTATRVEFAHDCA